MNVAAGVGIGAFAVLLIEAVALGIGLWLTRGDVSKLFGG